MLYIIRSLLVLVLSTHAGFSATELRFDASKDSELPDSAQIGKGGPGTNVEVSDNKLLLTTGTGNSERAAIAFPPTGESAATKSRELKLEIESLTNTSEGYGQAGLWAGFASAESGAQTIMSYAGGWLGIIVELRQGSDGRCYVTLRERWGISEGAGNMAHGVHDDSAVFPLGTLDALPTNLELTVKDGVLRISFTGTGIGNVSPDVNVSPEGSQLEKTLQPGMAEILKGDLETAFGLTNYGETPEASVLRLKSFSVKE